MSNPKTLDLEPIITGLCYRKSETLTETEIRQAITEAMLNFGVEYVTTLPTGDNIKQKVYILPDTSGTAGNFGDIYVYDRTNGQWIHIDALKFNINDYLLISDIVDNVTSTNTNKALSANQGKVLKVLVDAKVNTSDVKDNLTSTDIDKPLSAKQGKELKTLVDGKSASGHGHGNISNTGTLNSDISSVNKVVVTDSSNNVKTISILPFDKVIHQDISGKVDKVTGKQLSTEDYTTAEKNKLASIDPSSYITNKDLDFYYVTQCGSMSGDAIFTISSPPSTYPNVFLLINKTTRDITLPIRSRTSDSLAIAMHSITSYPFLWLNDTPILVTKTHEGNGYNIWGLPFQSAQIKDETNTFNNLGTLSDTKQSTINHAIDEKIGSINNTIGSIHDIIYGTGGS